MQPNMAHDLMVWVSFISSLLSLLLHFVKTEDEQ